MTKIIKGEDIGLPNTGEYELASLGGGIPLEELVFLRRLPEKSELEKWADEYFTHKEAKFGAMKGAEKMLEVAEKAETYYGYTIMTALKKFAGVR